MIDHSVTDLLADRNKRFDIATKHPEEITKDLPVAPVIRGADYWESGMAFQLGLRPIEVDDQDFRQCTANARSRGDGDWDDTDEDSFRSRSRSHSHRIRGRRPHRSFDYLDRDDERVRVSENERDVEGFSYD